MENEYEVTKKYLPMIFELDFNIAAPASIHDWYTMTWGEFEKKMEEAGVQCTDCKVRDWKTFFHAQHQTLKMLENNT